MVFEFNRINHASGFAFGFDPTSRCHKKDFLKRKSRKGAYWEDRYHATAIEADKHLLQCLVYIDLNMVRAGVVDHPSEWGFCGYNEIVAPRQ